MQEQIATVRGALPEGAAASSTEQAVEVAGRHGAAGWGAVLGFLFALWGASRG
jgi:hypothetical protein